MKALNEISNRAKKKAEKAEQKLFNSYVNWLIKDIKKGCKRQARKGFYEYKLDVRKFRKGHRKFALQDLMFCVQVEYLSKANIKMTSDGICCLIFKWDGDKENH